MDDAVTLNRLALLEAHVDWLYKAAGYAAPYGHAGVGLKEAKDAVDKLG